MSALYWRRSRSTRRGRRADGGEENGGKGGFEEKEKGEKVEKEKVVWFKL